MRRVFQKQSPVLVYIISIFLFWGCAATQSGPGRTDTYEEWLFQCKDYRDVERWMSRYFTYDIAKLRQKVMKTNTPEETFMTGTGVCKDAAEFAAASLNKINPEYKAGTVRITTSHFDIPHVACFFYLNEKLFVMDYGTMRRTVMGVHGPLKDLQEWADWYSSSSPDMKGRRPVVTIETPTKELMSTIDKAQEQIVKTLERRERFPEWTGAIVIAGGFHFWRMNRLEAD